MNSFPDIHTHHASSSNQSIRNLYKDFGKADNDGFFSLGIHPWYIDATNWKEEFEKIKDLSQHSNVLAIGECGLDKVTTTPFDLQQQVFIQQIQWASEIQKPMIIHCVRAYDEVLQLLKKHQPGVPVIFHGFNKSAQLANQIINTGYYLSFGEALQKENIQKIFGELPIDKIFLETDDSHLSIKEIYPLAAKARSISEESLSLQLQKNIVRVFGTDLSA